MTMIHLTWLHRLLEAQLILFCLLVSKLLYVLPVMWEAHLLSSLTKSSPWHAFPNAQYLVSLRL